VTFGLNVHFRQEPVMLELPVKFAVNQIHLMPEMHRVEMPMVSFELS